MPPRMPDARTIEITTEHEVTPAHGVNADQILIVGHSLFVILVWYAMLVVYEKVVNAVV